MIAGCRWFRKLVVLIAISAGIGSCSLPPARTPEKPRVDLQERLEMLLEDGAFRGVTVGISVRTTDPPSVLAAIGDDGMMTPASTVKLLTTGTALARLGPSYVFITRLVYAGRLDEHGVLDGDLLVLGGGDPTFPGVNSGGLGLDLYEVWADLLRALGFRRIDGRVIAVDGFFEDAPLGSGWCWDDQGFHFSAEISGLNFAENCVRVFVLGGDEVGGPARVWLWPKTQYVTLENRVWTAAEAEEDSVAIRRSVCENTIMCEGSILQESPTVSERVAVADPALYAATVLDDVLKLRGVEVRGKPERQTGLGTTADTTRVTEHVSPPLREIIKRVNKESDNLCAEALLRTLGRELRDRGDSSSGLEAVREFVLSCGVDSTALVLVDGSGLSRLNALSASAVTRFLSSLSMHAEFPEFYQSLAIAGVDGTLEERFLSSAAQGILRGKSGSMTGVAALSGYLIDRQGRQIAFSILLNGYRSDGGGLSDLVDLLAGEISGFAPPS